MPNLIQTICDVPLTSVYNGVIRITRVAIYNRAFTSYREYNQKPRIFPWVKNFTVENDIFEGERYNKPYKNLRPLLKQALIAAGVPKDEVEMLNFRWSIHAGCKMCPCSPGFIISNFTSLSHKDISIEYEYVKE